MCILSCPFEPPKPKTKHKHDINTRGEYEKLYQQDQDCFKEMVQQVEDCGANLIICQWGFDDRMFCRLFDRLEVWRFAIATGVRVLVQGGNKMIVDKVKLSLYDATSDSRHRGFYKESNP